jgi:hypothetical protein
MPLQEPKRTVTFDPNRPEGGHPMKRILVLCLLALTIVPSVASAAYQVGDSPTAISTANGPRPAAPVVREVHTITTHTGNQTVPVVLAALALSVAVAGTGYMTLRIRPLLRS